MAQEKDTNRGRKFNIGRQDEQLLNDELHSLFMSLKYLNYDRYKAIEEMMQERQTAIPDHALRIRHREGQDLLQAYYPTIGDGVWKNLFDGYFHPASTERFDPQDGTPVAPYQLCIDPKFGTIHYWDPNQKNWILANANYYDGSRLDTFNGMNYQYISPLEKISDEYYPVPFVPYGKLFSSSHFVSPSREEDGYIGVNNCGVVPGSNVDEELLTWVHVNATKLIKVDQRFIEIERGNDRADRGFVGVTSLQSEFYLFEKNCRGGRLLIKDKDFFDVVGGIQLSEEILFNTDNKYIYALTYYFDESPSNDGVLYSRIGKLSGKNEVYIGALISDSISIFMDGLSLEQTDENDNDIYIHDRDEGTIIFTDDDDAEIINQMQMSTLLFPKRTADFTLSIEGANITINEDSVTVEVGNNISGWKTPMVFCSGLGLQETEIFEDVIVNENSVTIKGLILPNDDNDKEKEIIKGYVADVGDSFVCKGVLNKPYIEHEDIKAGEEYAVFVNGILLTPTNQDISVDNGIININNAEDVEFDNLDYVVFNIDDADENKIALVFDESVSYYSIRIDDGGKAAVYNDCNFALLYVNSDTIDGYKLLLDQAAIERPTNPVEGYYKGGQIIKATDHYGNYTYYKYDYTEKAPKIISEEQAAEVEALIGYYSTTGSIHLIGDNKEFEGGQFTYYAYNFANMIDEVTVSGNKEDLPIPVIYFNDKVDHEFSDESTWNEIYYGSAGRLEGWKINCESLSTYINGLIYENKEINSVEGVTRHYSVTHPKLKIIKDKDYYGERNLWYGLETLYNKYVDKVEEYKSNPEFENVSKDKIKAKILSQGDINTWQLDEQDTVKNYFYSELLSKEALELTIYIHEDMKNEYTSYAIERIERDEFFAAHRDYIYLEAGATNIHPQVYRVTQDTIEADFLLVPGTVNIYLNGQLLAYEDYCKFDNNKIMFNVDVCGVQQLPRPEKMAEYLPEDMNEEDKEEYKKLLEKKQVIRIIEDIPYYIPTESRDVILVEKRDDMSIKSVTYDILTTSYNSFEFTKDYYDMPDSLMNTTDFVKIYINGIYYDEGYTFTNAGGIKGIKLLGKDALTIDPIYEFFTRNPEEAEKYLQLHGEKYQRNIDKITFEWR